MKRLDEGRPAFSGGLRALLSGAVIGCCLLLLGPGRAPALAQTSPAGGSYGFDLPAPASLSPSRLLFYGALPGNTGPASLDDKRILLRARSSPGFPNPVETAGADTVFKPPIRDPWFGFDKVQHFTFSFLWTVGSQYALVNKLSVREGPALPVSLASAASAGLLKEVYDVYLGPTRYFSTRDLVADGLGLLFATGFILL